MSQTLPELVASPCPIRETNVAFRVRVNLLLCLGRCMGFSVHPCYDEHVIVNHWKSFSDFEGEAVAGTLEESRVDHFGPKACVTDKMEWLLRRLPFVAGDRSSFRLRIEEETVQVDVRVLASAIYFRLHDHLRSGFDYRRLSPYDWAPDGMTRYGGLDDEEIVHFRSSDWKPKRRFWRVLLHGWEGARED